MKYIVKLEWLTLFLLGSYVFIDETSILWFLLLLLSPDLSMVGYLVNNRIGAYLYNFVHHIGLAVLYVFIGHQLEIELLFLAGVLLFTHSALDRMSGYGLKLEKGFQYTHLGKIGK